MTAGEKLRTYSVVGHWRVGKVFTVEARTAEEAKAMVRADRVEAEDQSYAEFVRVEARWERDAR